MPNGAVPTVSLISLGCPRTLVDSEVYLGRLREHGFQPVEQVESSDVVVINTCSFIQESIQESIDTILDAVELKKRGKLKAVIVAGCLVQRFKQGLIKELPDVDGFVGIDGFDTIETVARRVLDGLPRPEGSNSRRGQRPIHLRPRPISMYQGLPPRIALTANHYAYLKISEGCLKGCSFCIIPKIKGPLSSRPLEALVEEARRLVEERGIKELIVVGQDTSDYGIDLYGRPRTAELLEQLGDIEGLVWIRLLYCHPRGITPEIISAIRDVPRVCKYLDMAIEHADDGVLARMNRGITQERLLEAITELRRQVPGMALRTSLIVGFPGETDEEFEQLCAFIQTVRFERLGAFKYSNEEGAASFRHPNQVPQQIVDERHDRIMTIQQEIAAEINRRWLKADIDVLIDEPDPNDPAVFLGRSRADCPEVDGLVYVTSRQPLSPGRLIRARVTDTYEYDLVAEVVAEVSDTFCQKSV